MEDFTLAIYCFIDDMLKKSASNSQHFNSKLSDSQVITTLIISAKYFYGNQAAACGYMKSHYGFNIPDKSNFNRKAHILTGLIADLFFSLGLIFKELNIESVYLIDSFPIPICKNIRIGRSKLLKGEEFRGYNASKREWFYGFKVHVITTADGIPVEFYVSPGSTHDAKAFQVMNVFLPEKSRLYGDNAYDCKEHAALLLEFKGITLRAAKRQNAKVLH